MATSFSMSIVNIKGLGCSYFSKVLNNCFKNVVAFWGTAFFFSKREIFNTVMINFLLYLFLTSKVVLHYIFLKMNCISALNSLGIPKAFIYFYISYL